MTLNDCTQEGFNVEKGLEQQPKIEWRHRHLIFQSPLEISCLQASGAVNRLVALNHIIL